MNLLENKVILITGSSRGIGHSVAKHCALQGAKVVINYRYKKAQAETLMNEIVEMGGEAIAVQADVSLVKDARHLVDETIKAFGRIDCLVNNAGIWVETPADTLDIERTDLILDINLKSVIFMSNLVIPFMKKQGSGKIINISSTAGQRGEALHSVYAASKGGIIAYTRSLSSELAKHSILVNGVAPGWVDTELNDSVFLDAKKKMKIQETIPIGRIPHPDDIAHAVVYLASHWADALSGEIINVNGGSVLQ